MDCQLFKVIHKKSQFLSLIRSLTIYVNSRFELRDATFGSMHPRHELFLVDRAFRVTVDESLHAALQLNKLRFQDFEVFGTPANGRRLLMLLLQLLWIRQQSAHFHPDGSFDEFTSDLRIVADSLSSKAITIRAGAAVIKEIFETTASASLTRRLPVISISALRAGKETLEQIARPPRTDPGSLLVFI